MDRRIIIIGGGAAGMSAAMSARRQDRNVAITVISKSAEVSFSRCGVPYLFFKETQAEDLIIRPPSYFKLHNIELKTCEEVATIDPEKRKITTDVREYIYSRLILATGTSSTRPPDFKGGITLESPDLKPRYETEANYVLIGGGLTAIEFSLASIRKKRAGEYRGHVKIMGKTFLPGFSPEIVDACRDYLESNGVNFEKKIWEFPRDKASLVSLAKKREIVFVLGRVPCLPSLPGLALCDGAIRVNERMATNVPSVFAAGDTVILDLPHFTVPRCLPFGQIAIRGGQVAGTNAALGHARLTGIQGAMAISDIRSLGKIGLGADELNRLGMPFLKRVRSFRESAKYNTANAANAGLEGSESVYVVYTDEANQRVLGAEIFGSDKALGRLNTLLLAMNANLSPAQIVETEFLYHPRFAAVFDPLQRLLR